MAEEIKIPCNFWPSRASGAYYDVVDETTDLWNPSGVVLPDVVSSTIHFQACSVVPDDVNVTPAAQLWIYWCTPAVSTVTTIDIDWVVRDIQDATDTLDPTAWESTGSFKVASAGANLANVQKITAALTGTEFVAGRDIIGNITRDAAGTNPDDTLAGNILVYKILLVMNV